MTELVVHTDVEGLDVLPASEDLWALDLEAAGGRGWPELPDPAGHGGGGGRGRSL